MIVSKTVIKHKIENFAFNLVCPPDAPCHVILDALRYYKGVIQEIIEEAQKKQEIAVNDEPKNEPVECLGECSE